MPRPITLLLVYVLLALGVFLRFYKLDNQSLWNDEMYSRSVAQAPLSEFRNSVENDGHPPMHAMQLIVWERLFGDSVSALRVNSALWSCLSLGLLAWLVVLTGGNVACALIAVSVFAFSPLALGYAQEIRPYAMGATLICGCAVLLLNRRYFPLLMLLSLMACFTHYWCALSTAALLIAAWIENGNALIRRRLMWVGSVCAIGLILWLPVFLEQVRATSATNAFWMSPPGLKNLLSTFLAFSQVSFRFASNTFVLSSNPEVTLAVLAAYATALGFGLWKAPRFVVWWLVLGIGLPFLLSFWKPHLYVAYRYPYIVYPAFVLLVAHGVQAMENRWLRWTSLAVVLSSSALGARQYFNSWEKANPKAVAEYVAANATEDTLIVRPAYFAKLFGFYYGGKGTVIDEHLLYDASEREKLAHHPSLFVSFDVPDDPVRDQLLRERPVVFQRAFSGHSRLGITVYSLDTR